MAPTTAPRRWAVRTMAAAFAVAALLFPAVQAPPPVHAAALVVNTLADADPPLTDGLCSLREAITNANANAATWPDCAAGAGADTIVFGTPGYLSLSYRLPVISDPAGLVIDGASNQVYLSAGSGRLLSVSVGAILELRSLFVQSSGWIALAKGGALLNEGTLVVTSSTLKGGEAKLGGAIYNSGSLTLVNTTISGNRVSDDEPAGRGGGVYNSGTLIMRHTTVSENSADQGGGLWNEPGASATLIHSVITGNKASESPECSGAFTGQAVNHVGLVHPLGGCLINGGVVQFGDPGLAMLGPNGGSAWSYALLPGSALIDKGHPGTCSAIASDQRGFPRTHGVTCDLGSVEVQAQKSYLVNSAEDHSDVTPGDGTCMTTAGNCTLRAAIQESEARIGYPQSIGFGGSYHIVLTEPLPAIFNGAGTTIDGSGYTITIDGASKWRGLRTHGTVTLRSLVIKNGLGDGIGGHGAGILNSRILYLDGVVVRDNVSYDWGGGIANYGKLALANTHILNNRAGYRGGGIYSDGPELWITSSEVAGNSTLYWGSGGVYSESGGPVFVDSSSFIGNTGHGEGGGLRTGGQLLLQRSTVRGNSAYGGKGGGIAALSTTVISGSSIVDNAASEGGGMFAGLYGSGDLYVTNSTIGGNNAALGAGLYLPSGFARLLHTTVTANGLNTDTAPQGGGVYNITGTIMLENSILAGNGYGTGSDCVGLVFLAGPTLVSNDTGCTFTGQQPIIADPYLAPLASNGGQTETYALLPDSPALNAGDTALCAADPANGLDQRGVSRPQGLRCDLGAFESGLPTQPVGGRNLRILASPLGLRWTPGSSQTSYQVLRHSVFNQVTNFVTLPASAMSHQDQGAPLHDISCYLLAPLAEGEALGLSDLECAYPGTMWGTQVPTDFSLVMHHQANATLTWVNPPYVRSAALITVPLDGSPIASTPLSFAGSVSVPLGPSGACFQVVAFSGGWVGGTDILCGIPGVSTLGTTATGRAAADPRSNLEQALSSVRTQLATVPGQVALARQAVANERTASQGLQ